MSWSSWSITGALMAFWEWLRTCWVATNKAMLGALYQPLLMIGALFYGIAKLVGFVMTSLEKSFGVIATVTQAGSDATSRGAGQAASDWVATMNSFLPLDSLIAWVQLLIAMASACLIYRFIKSWIPTVSG
jgi:hypothetical protein